MKLIRQLFLPNLFVFFLVLSTQSTDGIAQSSENGGTTKEKLGKDGADSQTSLQGLTEAVLVDGKPVLKILSRKMGSTEVRLSLRDGEDAIVFAVNKFSYKFPSGKLYVTKTKIVFDPFEKKSAFFNLKKAEIEKANIKKQFGPGGASYLSLQTKDAKELVSVSFDGEVGVGDNRYAKPALELLLRAIENFDSALSEFNQLTASVRPEREDEEGDEVAVVETGISDKYDRFRDVTSVSTGRMPVRGSRRPVRIEVGFSFEGKAQKQPEKVALSLFTSAARPLFKEDDLELNFLIDGKRFPLGGMRLTDESKTKSTVKQTANIAITLETFIRLANAQTAEFQVGMLEYKLTDRHFEAFRNLLTYKVNE